MPTSPSRRRIEVPVEVYDELERQARWLHIPVTNLATLLLHEGLERMRRDTSPAIGLARIREVKEQA